MLLDMVFFRILMYNIAVSIFLGQFVQIFSTNRREDAYRAMLFKPSQSKPSKQKPQSSTQSFGQSAARFGPSTQSYARGRGRYRGRGQGKGKGRGKGRGGPKSGASDSRP